MMIRYFLLFLLSIEIANAASTKKSQSDLADSKKNCNITTLHERKARLMSRKKYIEEQIQELWNKTNDEEADASEPAKLKSLLSELNSIDRKLIRNERLLQKQLCRFL